MIYVLMVMHCLQSGMMPFNANCHFVPASPWPNQELCEKAKELYLNRGGRVECLAMDAKRQPAPHEYEHQPPQQDGNDG